MIPVPYTSTETPMLRRDISSVDLFSNCTLLESASFPRYHHSQGTKDPRNAEFPGHFSFSSPWKVGFSIPSWWALPPALISSLLLSLVFSHDSGLFLKVYLSSSLPLFSPLNSWFFPELEYITANHLFLSKLSLMMQGSSSWVVKLCASLSPLSPVEIVPVVISGPSGSFKR